jgi:preprotein translocase subunit SecF
MSTLTRLFNGQSNYDFIGRRKRWYALSAVVIAVALLGLFVFRLNAGIDFTGGDVYDFAASGTSVERVTEVAQGAGADEPQVTRRTTASGDVRYQVKTTALPKETSDRVVDALASEFKTDVAVKQVGATWGSQIRQKAVKSLIFFLIAVFAYISVRFEWRMAVGAIGALAHDLLITAGVYAIVGFEVTPSTVIALLTILGYSLYDTVVVFDKLRENTVGLAGGSRMTYGEAANLAVNQTLMRSINTSLTGLIPVGAILFVGAPLGAVTLKDLGLALFVGLIASTYSSIFFATPIVVDLKEREPQYKALAARVAARRGREGGPVKARTGGGKATSADPSDAAVSEEEADTGGKPITAASGARSATRTQPPRPKPKSKSGRPSGKKRR